MPDTPDQKPVGVSPQVAMASVSEAAKVPRGRRKMFLPVILFLLLLAGAVLSYWYFFGKDSNQDKSPKQLANQTDPVFNLATLSDLQFATYKETKSAVKPVLPAYTVRSSELVNLSSVAKVANMQFTTDQLQALESTGFFTQSTQPSSGNPDEVLYERGGRSDDMVDLYGQIGGSILPVDRKPENAVFITSDLLLHTYHVLLDRTFQDIEEKKLYQTLSSLTKTLYTDSRQRYQVSTDASMKESLKRLTVFYLVPLAILDTGKPEPKDYFSSPEEESTSLLADQSADAPDVVMKHLQQYKGSLPDDVFQLAVEELELVLAAKKAVSSPLYGSFKPADYEDYTQYKPRGHYTKSSTLRSYFRAMMWYGRHGFDVKSSELTRDAIVMTWQLGSLQVNGKQAITLWEDVYLPTVFFVGKSDDLTLYDYGKLLQKHFGEQITFGKLNDLSKQQTFQADAKKLPGPRILSAILAIDPINPSTKDELLQSTKGFRFMGQRFIPDSYMFSSLTQGDEPPDPETGQRLPSTPTALMVMSILGSSMADTQLAEWVKTQAPNSDKVIVKVKNALKKEFDSYDQKTWTQNIYWSWLYNLQPLFDNYKDGYPMFMKGLAWSKKSLQTALGSWTELRHDTLLYAKQSYAEMGGGPPDEKPPAVPKGYVEPNLPFLTRLIALTNFTKDGLSSRGLLSDTQRSKFESLAKSTEFFKTIAEKELANVFIPDEDFENLRTIVRSNFPNIVWTPDGGEMTERDARMGIIADVHTDAKLEQILYEATGTPSVIYVAVKDKNGTRLTRGAVYSYYEFTKPLGERLSDTDWQDVLYDGKTTFQIPPIPEWTNELVK